MVMAGNRQRQRRGSVNLYRLDLCTNKSRLDSFLKRRSNTFIYIKNIKSPSIHAPLAH